MWSLFRSNSDSNKHFPEIKIAKRLALVRRELFSDCVKALGDSYRKGHSKNSLQNTSLGGCAELALMSCQLYYVSDFIDLHKYIQVERRDEFDNTLLKRVCGSKLNNCLKFSCHYKMIDYMTRSARFCHDIAEYITESSNVVIEMSLLNPIATYLYMMTQITVADAFGDEAAVQILKSGIEQMMQDTTTSYINNVKDLKKNI